MNDEETLDDYRIKSAKDEENEMINLSMARTRELINSPKPPVQLILHFLRLATEKTMLEREKLRRETTLLAAKAKSVEASNNQEELVREAIAAMTDYAIPEDDYYDEYDEEFH